MAGAGGPGRAAEPSDGPPGPFHVATLLDNVPEHVLWLGGAALAGAVVVGGNSTHRGADLARDLAHTQCQLLVTDRAHLPLVDGLDLGPGIGTVGASSPRVVVVDDPAYRRRARPRTTARPLPDPAAVGVDEDSLGYLIFTSGTSGAPKACRCTQGRMARIGIIVAQMFSLTADDVCYVSMPLFHSNALMAGLAPALAAGATIALPTGGRFSASGFLPDVRRHGVTYFNYVGKPLSYILATPERPDDAENPLVRVFGNEGAEADIVRFGERFGCVVVDSYGSTEGGATVQRTPDTPRGALGRAPEGTMVVDPETGRRVRPWRASTTTACSSTPRRPSASSSPTGGGSGLRGVLAQRRRRAGPPAQRVVLDRGPRLSRRGGLLLLRGTIRRLVAGRRRELRGRTRGPHPGAPSRRGARRRSTPCPTPSWATR